MSLLDKLLLLGVEYHNLDLDSLEIACAWSRYLDWVFNMESLYRAVDFVLYVPYMYSEGSVNVCRGINILSKFLLSF